MPLVAVDFPAVGVEHRPGPDVAVDNGHLQGVDDQAGAHVVDQLPADDHAGGQIDHGRQVEPTFAGFEVK
ncbi:hypothetical protein Vau01_110690 [Virgisporangium aurantiacum]|uniref:Uncharacterized protein n=1 Tax=Virgisporangium aurantiacum TaxID=175570 RepID=A0A8J4E6W2_9ACTN|nr:hypothetical protein Vau01_110690 [Virgisporangium aurantiacum]